MSWHRKWVINAHAPVAVCRSHFSSLSLPRKHFQISRENHEVPLVTPRFKAKLKAAIFYLWSAERLKVHATLLQHQIGTEYFYCTAHWTSGYRQHSLHVVKAQTQQVTGYISHRPHLLLLLQMAGIWRKDRAVAVSAVFPVWVGVIDVLETQVFWGVEERARNECPGKWALTLGWKELRGCWDGQKWPDNHRWAGTCSCDTSPYLLLAAEIPKYLRYKPASSAGISHRW